MKHRVLLLLIAASLAVPAFSRELLRIEDTLDAMGTTYSVVAYGEDQFKLRSAVEQSFDEVRRLDRLLSNYRPDSELSVINREAARRAVRTSAEMFQLLSDCLAYSRASEGAFDITVGPLMRVWGFYRGTGRLPHRAEIRGAMARTGYRKVLLDAREGTVRFAREGVQLDPGGIGKGYAVDKIVAILRENGVTRAYVSAGGSSVYGLDAPPGEKGWKVKIRDPKRPSQTIQEVLLNNQSMSTSGNYEKFFWAGGKLYSHIMDPRTGYPAQGSLSVSVIAPRTLDSEAWTKPYFILGREWAVRHKPKSFRVFFCEEKSEQSCAWLQ